MYFETIFDLSFVRRKLEEVLPKDKYGKPSRYMYLNPLNKRQRRKVRYIDIQYSYMDALDFVKNTKFKVHIEKEVPRTDEIMRLHGLRCIWSAWTSTYDNKRYQFIRYVDCVTTNNNELKLVEKSRDLEAIQSWLYGYNFTRLIDGNNCKFFSDESARIHDNGYELVLEVDHVEKIKDIEL